MLCFCVCLFLLVFAVRIVLWLYDLIIQWQHKNAECASLTLAVTTMTTTTTQRTPSDMKKVLYEIGMNTNIFTQQWRESSRRHFYNSSHHTHRTRMSTINGHINSHSHNSPNDTEQPPYEAKAVWKSCITLTKPNFYSIFIVAETWEKYNSKRCTMYSVWTVPKPENERWRKLFIYICNKVNASILSGYEYFCR